MWAVTICNNIKEGTGERMEERKMKFAKDVRFMKTC